MTYHVINGDARQTGLPDAFFHCVATSPPYFGLREYGDDDREIGDEKTPSEYVAEMVNVGREVRRVMRDDGVWWLNLGDKFVDGDLLGIPFAVRFALREIGWKCRAVIPWVKGSAMPESVRNRPTVAHEYVFQLVKQQRYFWDPDAVRVLPTREWWNEARGPGYMTPADGCNDGGKPKGKGHGNDGRNIRTSDFFNAGLDELQSHIAHVRENGGMMLSDEGEPLAFMVNPVGSKLAHFAMWPPKLVAPMILSSTSAKGCCPKCGAQWVRVVEKSGSNWSERKAAGVPMRYGTDTSKGTALNCMGGSSSTTLGFSPSCKCNAGEPIPCRVLDPFAGSGTTLQVCEALGRDSWGVELMAKNIPIIAERMKEKIDPQNMKRTKGHATRPKTLSELHAEYMANIQPMTVQ